MTATRPGGGPLTGNPADLVRENRELHRLRAQVAAVREMHVSAGNYTGCRACQWCWPCPTAKALGVTR